MKRVSLVIVVASFALFLAMPGMCLAADNSDDVQALKALGNAYRAAFAEADAAAIAGLFTEDGDFIDASGRLVEGRQAIAMEYEGFFAVHGKVELLTRPVGLKFLGPDVAVVDGVAQADPPTPGPPTVAHWTTICVKRNNKWQFQSIRESITFPPSHFQQLEPLEWLIGSWSYGGKGDKLRGVQLTFQWDLNKNFIIRTHEMDVVGEGIVGGTQWIGWDPAAKTIRSWLFTSTGDHIEATWKQDGKRWVSTTSGVFMTPRIGRNLASRGLM
ncbi:MAG: SgcJ/EcaC family oxidoreductase, partial [Pirellulaceae bacterium]|nr:SgcJ/EcaC family oxidoreductase [Pirellulaceae bacterium]